MSNQTALITGASKRIGKFIAKHLAEKGYHLAIHYNSSEKPALNLQYELQQSYKNQKFEIFQCNLGVHSQVETLVNKVMLRFNQIDLLINNASVFDPGTVKETDARLFAEQMNVNLTAPFFLSKEYALSNKKGNIINFLDTRITKYGNSHAAYSLSKVTLAHFTKMAALEFAPEIRVNGIAPGATLPPEGKGEDYLIEIAQKTPMKISGGVEPIIQSLDYILENQNLTGQILYCDGGEHLL